MRHDFQIQRHSDAEEKEAKQQATEGLNIGFELVAEGGFGEQDARDKRAHRHRQPACFHQQRRAEDDEQRGGGHHFAGAGSGEDAEERVQHEQPGDDQRGECAKGDGGGLPQRSRRFADGLQRREKGDDGEQRHNQQIFKKEYGDNALSARGGDVAALVQNLHDDGGRGEDKARRADETDLPREAVKHPDGGEQDGADQHLQAAEAEYLAAQPPQMRGFHFQTDDEQKHHHAKFGDMNNRLRIGDKFQAKRANGKSGGEIAEYRAEAEPFEKRHGNHRRTQ